MLVSGFVCSMNMAKLIIFLACLVAVVAGLERRVVDIEPPLRWDFQPPAELTRQASRMVYQTWMTMPIDHFDPQNSDTFQMRYMFNEEFFGGDGSPIFILVGGEWTIAAGWLAGGNMYEMARENHGFQIYTEHRYYGETLPYRDFTAENLRFLNVDQALADLAHFINNIKKSPRFQNSPVILYGGSYAGNMVLWFKQRYPHLVLGGVASSGPIMGKVDFTGYLEMVHSAFLSEGGSDCIEIIRQGIEAIASALRNETDRTRFENDFRLCQPIDYENPFEVGYLNGFISWTFSGAVQTARPGSIAPLCQNFRSNVYGISPMQKIGGYIAAANSLAPTSCWVVSYENYVNSYNVAVSNSKAWYYQTCTEYGYFQTAPRIGTVFDSLTWLNVEFYADMCKRAFDPRFDAAFVFDAVDRVNLVFGGLNPDVNNTINIHGDIDPWRALGVYDRDLKESSPTFNIPRASHCFDMQNWLSTDTIMMSQAKTMIRRKVAEWLSNE